MTVIQASLSSWYFIVFFKVWNGIHSITYLKEVRDKSSVYLLLFSIYNGSFCANATH